MEGVILAAGNGERLWPLTATRPKPMIRIMGRTIIERIVEGIKPITNKIFVVTNGNGLLREHLNELSLKYNVEIVPVVQKEGKGTAVAVESVKDYVSDVFVVASGDHVLDTSIYRDIVNFSKGENTITVKFVEEPELYGVVDVEEGRVASIEEKPENPKTNLANIGIYVFNSSIFDEIKDIKVSKRGEKEITDVLRGKKVFITAKKWLDVAYGWHVYDAFKLLFDMEKERIDGEVKNTDIKGKVIIEKGAVVENSVVEDSYIGKDAKIGPFAYISKSCVEEKAEIGGATSLRRSVFGKGSKAKHLSYIGDSVIGEGVNFGSSTQLANLRFDNKHVKVKTKKGIVDSKRRKLGAIVGDNVKFGVNVSVMPGTLIKPDAWVMPNSLIKSNID